MPARLSALIAVLALCSLPAQAADWKIYHHDAQRGIEIALDQASLQQSGDSFSADIRLTVAASQQTFLGRQTIDCQANTYRLSNLRELRNGQLAEGSGNDDSGPIDANTANAGLKETYCARWQEPAGVRWQPYAQAGNESYFYDARVAQKRSRQRGEFPVWLKTSGSEKSLLVEVRLDCREKRFALLSGVYRNEAYGWLANIPAGPAQTPTPESSIAILQSMLCAPADKTARQPAR